MRWSRRRIPRVLFEFQPQPRSTLTAWLLLLIACVFAADIGWSYARVIDRTESTIMQLTSLPTMPRAAVTERPRYQPKDIDREVAFARGVVTKISLPWNEFFKALNASRIEEIQLIGMEPDMDSGTIRVTAEARDIPSMLTYVSRLESQGDFKSVALLRHEVKRNAPSGTVSFVVTAAWKRKW